MKRILFCLLAILFVATSCKDASFGIEYSLHSEGKADGNVVLMFDGGDLTLNGGTEYQLNWSNQINALDLEFVSLDQALLSKDPTTSESAERVNTWLDSTISVTSFEGYYDIYVKGYVKETLTQITFYIERRFTNIPNDESDPEEK